MKYLFSYLGTVLYVKIKQALGDNSEGLQLAISKLVEADLEKEQWADIMLRFSLGLFAIYIIFLLLYINAKKNKNDLGLNKLEMYKTQTSIQEFLILVCVTSLSILIVLIFGHEGFLYASLNYLLIPILLKVHDHFRSKTFSS
jgi:hypothetical protein